MFPPCKSAGLADVDISGTGILLALVAQALISSILAVCGAVEGGTRNLESTDLTPSGKRVEIIRGILLTVNDSQSFTAISLLISGLAQLDDMSLYHYHIVYDAATFTSISHAAAAAVSLHSANCSFRRGRILLIIAFLALYLAFTVEFGIHLGSWNLSAPGRCFNATYISLPNATHPGSDRIYLAITAVYTLSSFYLAAFQRNIKFLKKGTYYVIGFAILQFPLHLYVVIALKLSNKGLLVGGNEVHWGFGQIFAVAMLGLTCFQLADGIREYWKWRKENKARLDAEGGVGAKGESEMARLEQSGNS